MQGVYATGVEKLKSCDVSFFRLAKKLCKGVRCNKHPLRRFLTLMRKMSARSYIEEQLSPGAELLDEKHMAEQRFGVPVGIKATRLTFFASFPPSKVWSNKTELPDTHLLGYAVLVTLELPNEKIGYLLEAVIQTPRIAFSGISDGGGEEIVPVEVANYYIHNYREYKTTVGIASSKSNRDFTIIGNFFTQQNNLTSTCGHASLRMIVNSAKSAFLGYGKMDKLTNRRINEILDLDFSSPEKTVGYYKGDASSTKRGLNRDDIEKVVKSLGGQLTVVDFSGEIAAEYDEIMYPMVESSFPTILEIKGWNTATRETYAHAVAIMGHTWNSDRWEPEANIGYGNYPRRPYIRASSWVCHYLMSDDNYGMNVTLPSDMIRNDIVPYKNPKLHATRIMSITPKIRILGYDAQEIAVDIAKKLVQETRLSTKWFWLDELRRKVKSRNLVARTIFLTRNEYLSYLKEQESRGNLEPSKEQMTQFQSVPTKLWVTEITIPNLYAGNKMKLGDVLINATASKVAADNNECFVLAWLPGFIRYGLSGQTEPWLLYEYADIIRSSQEALVEW
ncbi:MAG: hypothetical protein DRP66_01150 [Planctomycetota bacterium]|nr:MAG: hypothetical protein DRP66_01150 [Planctomycetota bacterium]